MPNWVYRQPITEWFFGRNRLLPLGAPTNVVINAPVGVVGFVGRNPTIQTALPTGVSIPLVTWIRRVVVTGVYRAQTFVQRRVVSVVPEHTGAAAGVTINAPAGVFTMAGQGAQLTQVLNAPRGSFDMQGLTHSLPSIQGTRRERQSKAWQKDHQRRRRRGR